MTSAPVAAVFNTSPDTIEMLLRVLGLAGFAVVSEFTYDIREGRTDLEAFMRQHRPNVIVYDIAPPYQENYQLFLHLRSTPALRDCPIVITTTNAAHVQQLVGKAHRVYEVVGKPFDLDEIVQAVKEAVRSRPTT